MVGGGGGVGQGWGGVKVSRWWADNDGLRERDGAGC